MADEIIDERQHTHGDYATNANISQEIKEVFHKQKSWQELNSVQKESLDMIALKVSRILSGHANFKDHWDDVAGYATLVAQRGIN